MTKKEHKFYFIILLFVMNSATNKMLLISMYGELTRVYSCSLWGWGREEKLAKL